MGSGTQHVTCVVDYTVMLDRKTIEHAACVEHLAEGLLNANEMQQHMSMLHNSFPVVYHV